MVQVLAASRLWFVLLVACVAGVVMPARAEEPKKDDLPVLRNTSVSIPWTELRDLLERTKQPPEERAPVDYVFAPATYSATIAGNLATVTVQCEVTTLNDKWTLVPIGPAVAGVLKATANGEACSLVMKDQSLYALLSGKGKKKLEIVIERPVTAVADGSSCEVPLLPSPVVNLTAVIPQAGLEITAPGASPLKAEEKAGATTLSAGFRGGQSVALSWRPKPKTEKLPARIYADTATRVIVEPSALRCQAIIRYDILRSGVDSLRIALPDGIELLGASGESVRQTEIVKDGKRSILLVSLKSAVMGTQQLTLEYEKRMKDDTSPDVPLVAHPDAVQDRGSVGVEAHGGIEVAPSAEGAERVDVKELPAVLWQQAGAPLILGFKYGKPGAKVALQITKHKDLDVLVAMSDICETSTVVTPDGKVVTKMMFVLRNNLKQFMTLDMPQGADVWSAFVDDRPVTPVRNAKGQVLIPLKKSEEVDEDDDYDQDKTSYRAKREQRRKEGLEGERLARKMVDRVKRARMERVDEWAPSKDLKPYDVEVVFVSPKQELGPKGEIKVALPKTDIPTGQMAWAVFLPENLRVVDAVGNFKEVRAFSLPFRHFGEAEYLRQQREKATQAAQKSAEQAAQQAELAKQVDALRAAPAKAQGVLPVRVEIPIVGEIHRFEKILVDNETPEMTITYRHKID